MKKTRTSTFQNKPEQAGASMKKIWGARKNKVPEVNFHGIGQKKMLLNAREIIGLEGVPHLILLAMEVIAPLGDKEKKGKSGQARREGSLTWLRETKSRKRRNRTSRLVNAR